MKPERGKEKRENADFDLTAGPSYAIITNAASRMARCGGIADGCRGAFAGEQRRVKVSAGVVQW